MGSAIPRVYFVYGWRYTDPYFLIIVVMYFDVLRKRELTQPTHDFVNIIAQKEAKVFRVLFFLRKKI